MVCNISAVYFAKGLFYNNKCICVLIQLCLAVYMWHNVDCHLCVTAALCMFMHLVYTHMHSLKI